MENEKTRAAPGFIDRIIFYSQIDTVDTPLPNPNAPRNVQVFCMQWIEDIFRCCERYRV